MPIFLEFMDRSIWNDVGIYDEKMYFKGEDYYGRSCSDNSDPGFGYHGNAGNSHGLDRAV